MGFMRKWTAGMLSLILVLSLAIPVLATQSEETTGEWFADEVSRVTFDPQGGIVSETSRIVENGKPYGDLPEPVRDGYAFLGWYDSGGNLITADSIVDTSTGYLTQGSAKTKTVTLFISDNPGLAALKVRLLYDTDALEIKAAEQGEIGKKFNASSFIVSRGVGNWNVLDGLENVTGDGALVTLTFALKDSAALQDYEIQAIVEEAFDINDQDIQFQTNGSVVKVVPGSGYQPEPVTNEPSIVLSSDKATIDGDGAATLAVSIKNNPGLAALKLRLSYDTDALEIQSAEQGEIGSEFKSASFVVSSGVGNWNILDGVENVTGDGTLATVAFAPKSGAVAGSYEIRATVEEAYDSDDKDLTFRTVSGVVALGGGASLSGDGEPSITVSSDDTLYAHWGTAPSVTVTGGKAEPSGAVEPGVKVTVTAESREGFVFQRWNGAEDLNFADGGATSPTATFYMPERDVNLTATYGNGKTFQVVRDAWNFGNTAEAFGYVAPLGPGLSYPISAKTFSILFGQSNQATQLYKRIRQQIWSGNCLGMSGLSALMYKDNDVSAGAFQKNSVVELVLTDSNGQINVKQFIEAMQFAQYSEMFATVNSRNRVDAAKLQHGFNLNDLVREAREGTQEGKCPVVTVEKSMGKGMAGHALLACGFEETGDGGRIHIYDCNYPKDDNRWMYVTRNAQGIYDGWRYEIGGDYGEWGSEDTACAVSFVPCETMERIWDNRGTLRGSLSNSFGKEIVSLDVSNANICNIRDEPVAKLENGAFFDLDNSNIVRAPHLSLNASNVSILYMPMDDYTISNTDQDSATWNIEAFSDSYFAEIQTMGTEVKLSFDENSSGRPLDVLVSQAGESERTTIKLTSYQTNPNIDSVGDEEIPVVYNSYGVGLQVSLASNGTSNVTTYGLDTGAGASTEKIVRTTLKGGELEVAYSSRVDAILYAVSFKEDGQMAEAVRSDVPAGNESVKLNFKKALPDPGYIKVLMLDKDTKQPLCRAY